MKRGIFLLFLLTSIGLSILPGKFHPGIHWNEISKNNFIVIYPLEYSREAYETLEMAQHVFEELQNLWNTTIKGKIRILLQDASDTANGHASFFPFNHIEIYLYHPPPYSELGNCRDWIRLVLTHELSHLFNYNSASKFTMALRNILGNNPLLFPMQQTPIWMIEGLSVWAESKFNPGGRLNTPDFQIILRTMAEGGSIPKYRTLYGEPTYWPGPNAKYIFGATFFKFLEDKYGEEKITRFVQYYTRHLVSISSSYRFKRFFGTKLSGLWREFARGIDLNPKSHNRKIRVLTDVGMSNRFPLAIDPARVLFVHGEYKKFPGICALNLDTGVLDELIEMWGVNGMSYDPEGNSLYLSAIDHYKSYFLYSDVYRFDLDGNRLLRLSRGKRLSCPVRHPLHPEYLYCIQRVNNRSHLVRFNPSGKSVEIVSPGYQSLDTLALSPDGGKMAVALKERDLDWSIGVFNLDGSLIRKIDGTGGKSYCPVWVTDEMIYFVTLCHDTYCLARFNLNEERLEILNDPDIPAIKFISTTPGRRDMLVSFFDVNGYNLGLINPEEISPSPPSDRTTPHPVAAANARLIPTPSRRYNGLRELLPKYVSPGFRYAGNDIQPGFITTGRDILNKHAYALEGFYGIRTDTLNFNFSYTYDGVFPTLQANFRNLTNLSRTIEGQEYIYTDSALEFVGLYPILTSDRHQSHIYTNLHFQKISEMVLTSNDRSTLNLNGFKLGFLYDSSQRFYDSFSQSDGILFSMSYSRDLDILGSTFDLNTLAFEYRQYMPLLRPNVFALRFGISDAWGGGERLFYMGGATPKTEAHIAGENPFDLMRGYPSGYFSGTGGFICNLEYRISLAQMGKSIIISRSLERLYLSVFTDIGRLWDQDRSLNPSFSFGMELGVVLYLGGRATVSGGVAIGRSPDHPPIFYLRLGESF